MDLATAGELVKSAVLYADKVTIYSPAASLLGSVQDFASISDPDAQIMAAIDVFRAAPVLAANSGVTLPAVEDLRRTLVARPGIVRTLDRMKSGPPELLQVKEFIGQFRTIFESGLMPVVHQLEDQMDAKDLLAAIKAGVVEIGQLKEPSPAADVAALVNAAMGVGGDELSDELVNTFAQRVIGTLLDPFSFPLLDPVSTDLFGTLGLDLPATGTRHGAEVTAATQMMGYLPYFGTLDMSDVLDIRTRLQTTLVPFRAAMIALSKEFGSRPLDAEFSAEVQDAWRETVEPALLRIQSDLRDHGFMQEVQSAVLKDPKRVMLELTAGSLAAAVGPLVDLGRLIVIGATAGIVLVDVVGRALEQVDTARRDLEGQGFYFLHRLGEESQRRSG